jgi:hypothetical protein
MGSGTFDPGAYRTYSASTRGKSTDEIYGSTSIHKNLDPLNVKMRESRDSTDNPNSTPIIIGIDVTGSMGIIADVIAREGLGTLFKEILDSKPISDPHVMFMAIGDANCDQAPLQVSQFEADNRIVEQLTQIWLEKGGGGNKFESYNLPWYFAAHHTVHDSMIKRGKRGYLFTIGDEQSPGALTKEQIKRFIGDDLESDVLPEIALAEAKRLYDVYHIVIAQGDYASGHPEAVRDTWNKLLGQHVIWLSDYKKLAETIVSTILVAEGTDAKTATKKFGHAVLDAVKHLPSSRKPRLTIKDSKS